MSELIIEKPKRLEFSVLDPGDELTIVTGENQEAWRYEFVVGQAERWPSGMFVATSPSGETATPIEFELHGCGQWTTKAQNPVQKQERAFTPYYDGLIVGHFLWGRLVSEPDRIVFDKPRQEISEMTRFPYRSNTVLQALGDHATAMSVREILVATEDRATKLEDRDIRRTLKSLVSTGQVAELKKKVLKYELNA